LIASTICKAQDAQDIVNVWLKNADELSTNSSRDSFITKSLLGIKDASSLAEAEFHIGQYFLDKNVYNTALKFYQKSLKDYYDKNISAFTAKVYNDIGFINGQQGKPDDMLNYYFKAIRIYEQYDDHEGLAVTNSNISSAYFDMGKKEDAIFYAIQSLRMRQKTKDWDALASRKKWI